MFLKPKQRRLLRHLEPTERSEAHKASSLSRPRHTGHSFLIKGYF